MPARTVECIVHVHAAVKWGSGEARKDVELSEQTHFIRASSGR